MRMRLPYGDGDSLMAACKDPHFLLDLVEDLLDNYGPWDSNPGILQSLLDAANSVYTLREDNGGLEFRVAPGVREEVEAVVASAVGSAGDHLTQAWNECYGRTPDPVKSYGESIRAVECALAPIVSPQNTKQTLGTMIRDIDQKPSKWGFVIPDGNVTGVGTVLSMMRLLWDGQSSRHGSVKPTRSETIEEARAAVHLAASLVQYGASGAFHVV